MLRFPTARGGNFQGVFAFLLASLAASSDSLPPTWDGQGLLRPAPRPEAVARRAPRPQASGPSDSARWFSQVEKIPHRILTTVFKPVDLVVRPTFKLLGEPLKPMIRYADSSELIDRGNALMRMGNTKGGTMLYPVATLTGNSTSRAGLRFRRKWDHGLRSDIAVRWSPSEEWGIWTSGSAEDLPADLTASAAYVHYETPNAPIWVPGASSLSPTSLQAGAVSETRDQFDLSLGRGLTAKTSGSLALQFTTRKDSLPVRLSDRLPKEPIPWLARDPRGTQGTSHSLAAAARVGGSTRDHEGIPTDGATWGLELAQRVSLDGGGMGSFGGAGTRYFLLGKEKYVFRRSDLDTYLKFNPSTLLDAVDPSTLWQRLTERRVVALYWSFQQGWENGSRPAPWFFFPNFGSNAPARGYDTRLTNLSLFGAGAEYRWPIWKYIDGSIYAEAAHASDLPWHLSYKGFAPGWGLGLRVRAQDAFFFRFQLTRSRTGTTYFLTTSPEF